jgi:hypothetical protein
MDITLNGIMQELESELDEIFPNAKFIGYYEQGDGIVVIEVYTPNDDKEEIEEEINEKCTELTIDYDYEFLVHVYDRSEKDKLNIE